MSKTLFEQFGVTYTQQGDYLLPDVKLPEEETQLISIWGQRHLRYLKEYHRIIYFNLLTSGKLNSYLADIDEQARNMFLRVVKQAADREGINEQMKAENQIEWVRRMNNCRERAIEIVNTDLIYN